MTAEAWVCRQFLGVGGPGPASTEAAEFLLQNDSDRGPSNFYYWYYATLALYQHGGEPWSQWNARIRDKIVGLQSTRATRPEAGSPTQPLRSQGGPDLLHDPGRTVARGLLPLPAALRRTQDPAGSRAQHAATRQPGSRERSVSLPPRQAISRIGRADRRSSLAERDRRQARPVVDDSSGDEVTSRPGPFRSAVTGSVGIGLSWARSGRSPRPFG